MARLVRSDVRELAATVGHPQFPAIYDQFDGAFSVVPALAATDAPADPALVVAAPAEPPAQADPPTDTRTADPCGMALPLWQAIENATTPGPIQAFIDTQGDCQVLRLLAETRLAEIMAASTAPDPAADSAPDPQPLSVAIDPADVIDFGDDSGHWPNDGECDDPRFAGIGMADTVAPGGVFGDATDCLAEVEAGRIVIVPGAAQQRRDTAALDFGDDSGPWPMDNECDDPRFAGPGSAAVPDARGILVDASDCRRLYEGGFVEVSTAPLPELVPEPAPDPVAAIDFGDDSGNWPNDGECDDPRFGGPGVNDLPVPADVLADATDCRAMVDTGRASLLPGAPAARRDTAGLDFGDDSGPWPNDNECDDPRFAGQGSAAVPDARGILVDATDCRRLYEGGYVEVSTAPLPEASDPEPAPAPAPLTIVLPPEARGEGVERVATFPAASELLRLGNARLPEEARAALEDDFGSATYYGAFALAKGGGWGYTTGAMTIEAARAIALAQCESVNDECAIYAELLPRGYVPPGPGAITLSREAADHYEDRTTDILYHAMAISVDGAYSKVWEATSYDAAAAQALEECEAGRITDLDLPAMPCFVLPQPDK
jgi:hypothetical protein